MEDIQRDSGVVRIRLDNPRHATSSSSSPDETTDLIIIGTKETVADALLLINHHVRHTAGQQKREGKQTIRRCIIQLATALFSSALAVPSSLCLLYCDLRWSSSTRCRS